MQSEWDSLHGVRPDRADSVGADEADVPADTGTPVALGLEAAPVDLHLRAGGSRRLAGVVERR